MPLFVVIQATFGVTFTGTVGVLTVFHRGSENEMDMVRCVVVCWLLRGVRIQGSYSGKEADDGQGLAARTQDRLKKDR